MKPSSRLNLLAAVGVNAASQVRGRLADLAAPTLMRLRLKAKALIGIGAQRQILERVAIDQQQIGERAFLDQAQLALIRAAWTGEREQIGEAFGSMRRVTSPNLAMIAALNAQFASAACWLPAQPIIADHARLAHNRPIDHACLTAHSACARHLSRLFCRC